MCSNTGRVRFIRKQLASWAMLHSGLEETLLVLIGSLFFTGPLWLNDVPGAVRRREMREKWSTSPFWFLNSRKLLKQTNNKYIIQTSLPFVPTQFYIHFNNVDSVHIVLYSRKTVSEQIFFSFRKMTLMYCLNSLR